MHVPSGSILKHPGPRTRLFHSSLCSRIPAWSQAPRRRDFPGADGCLHLRQSLRFDRKSHTVPTVTHFANRFHFFESSEARNP
jgi:hypothetical protein